MTNPQDWSEEAVAASIARFQNAEDDGLKLYVRALQRIQELQGELNEVRFIPGCFRCPTCGLRLLEKDIGRLQDGTPTITMGKQQVVFCPNGCTPRMERVTWKQEIEEADHAALKLCQERDDLQHRLEKVLPPPFVVEIVRLEIDATVLADNYVAGQNAARDENMNVSGAWLAAVEAEKGKL